MTRRLRFVIAERIKFVGAMEKTFDRSTGDNLVRRRQQDRLTHLMVPWTHAHGETLVAIEVAVAENEGRAVC